MGPGLASVAEGERVSRPGVVLNRAESSVLPSVRRGARNRSSAAEVYVRQWLARELHDSVAQVLIGMVIEIEQAKAQQAGRRTALEALDSLQASTHKVLANLRQTMLTLRGEATHGPKLDEWLPDILDRFQEETSIETRLLGVESWPSPLSTHASVNLSRIVEEALQNVRRHSAAQLVLVSLSQDDGVARLCLRDDGRGRKESDGSAWQGHGTLGMKERAMLLGGELRVESSVADGTTIEVRLPVENLTS
jgi:two-component system, NarL family, sensor kinase